MIESFSSDRDLKNLMLDSTITRAHVCAAGALKKTGVKNNKRQLHDAPFAQEMMTGQSPKAFIGDKGYDSDALVQWLEQQGIEVVIPPRSNRNNPRDYDEDRYKERNLVERFINKIKWFRRIFARFEKLASRYLAFLHWVGTLIWLR